MIKVEDKNGADGAFFVRRLSHVQHICQSVEGKMTKSSSVVSIARHLLDNLHPTPAVCGSPRAESFSFIRDYEGISFDRGMYAGPFGFLGADSADIIVAIRSALLTKELSSNVRNNVPPSTLSIYAGAGIVPGSTVQSEWSEVGYKLGVLSSTFTQSPLTLSSYQTPNEAWATVFVEELIRSGVTQFYVCPGSRSTPLTSALARAMRSHIGVIDCISTHDERGAAFRALGHARATRKAAAVVTSSGTAVANLYPAVMEASMDGVPLLLLTADRPYENRDTGANQAVDQVKVSCRGMILHLDKLSTNIYHLNASIRFFLIHI
jgi:isochorismate synthase/2-succinyl-5-enolpyruvyl-6-hydroxy-3-cyclohexene-1-carboxylate synthase/2-succinyl-6-hydroxy-2,4-cyclohexadiene-1-carboxylate synthase/O-succinylbenzoate synthase